MQPVKVGAHIHASCVKHGCMSSIFVSGALIDFYSKAGFVVCAHEVFDEIPEKNVVCANSLLAGYVESKKWMEGLVFFRRLHAMCIEPDGITLSGLLRICTEAMVIQLGLQTHAYLIRRIDLFKNDVYLQSCLVEMYGRCGLVDKAKLVFELVGQVIEERDVVLWTSMLHAYARNGQFNEVINSYEEMLAEGTKPDEVMFLAILSACSHSGHVMRGLSYFETMRKDYGLQPRLEHYGCVYDMLCKAGELELAWKFASEMVSLQESGNRCGVTVWGALLAACKDVQHIFIGENAAQKALELDPGNVGIYVELSNLYARAGKWDEIQALREMMKERGLKKDAGRSRL